MWHQVLFLKGHVISSNLHNPTLHSQKLFTLIKKNVMYCILHYIERKKGKGKGKGKGKYISFILFGKHERKQNANIVKLPIHTLF